MIKIRLKRYGRKRQPSYRIVVVDSRIKRDGRSIEELGFFNPITKDIRLNFRQIKIWLKRGAQPSRTVKNILIKAKIIP